MVTMKAVVKEWRNMINWTGCNGGGAGGCTDSSGSSGSIVIISSASSEVGAVAVAVTV